MSWVTDLPRFPMPRLDPDAPPPAYDRMRRTAPLCRVAFLGRTPVWVVTRYAEATQLLTDTRISTDPRRPGHPYAAMTGSEKQQAGQFIDMDRPDHGYYRKMLITEFSAKRIREMRPAVQRAADELIDRMLQNDRADLVESYGFPLSSVVICRLLGIPYEDHTYFQSRTRTMVAGFFTTEEADTARTELLTYVDELVTRAERRPGDNLLGRLAARRRATGELSHDAMVGMAFLLLVAGHHTTANMLPLGAYTLLRHPAQLAWLIEHPEHWPDALEELLRYHSIVDWVVFDRVAVEDLEIGGQPVHAGEGIFVLGASANRDERAFDRPDEFEVRRRAHHLAFGYGPHQCLGQNLARLELEIAYRTLFERVPTLHIDPDAEPSFKYDARTFGMHHLPVTW